MSEQRTVVVAMDGSTYADQAFDWYIKNFHKPNDHVIIVHSPEYHTVLQSPMVMADSQLVADLLAEEDTRIKTLLNEFGDKLRDAGIGGKVKSVSSGGPGEVVIKVAEEEEAHMIVCGTRGKGTIRRTLLGSVSDYIMHHSHVPVVVWRTKHEHHKKH